MFYKFLIYWTVVYIFIIIIRIQNIIAVIIINEE